MIKITSTANKTITITDNGTSGTAGISTFVTLGVDCQIKVYDAKVNQYDYNYRVLRTVQILNKSNSSLLVEVNVETLDPTSTSYSSNMNTYANNLITVLYA